MISTSSEQTRIFGREIGKKLVEPTILCLYGDLGAGKTTLVKGIVEGALNIEGACVSSPTFSYLNIYSSSSGRVLYHFDLYRLKDIDAFLCLGFEEYIFAKALICIEWSERIASLLPKEAKKIHLTHVDEHTREISFN